jgi:hypothetical protein
MALSAQAVLAGNGVQDEQRSTLQDQKEMAVTIYNNDLALIKDVRRIKLVRGQIPLAFRDVSAQIRPETALLRSLSAPTQLSVLEQNFEFSLLTPESLLAASVGKDVTLVRSNPTTGADSSETARVLAAKGGVVLQVGSRIETGAPGRLIFPDVPANLRDRPTLVMTLENQNEAEQDVELSYLSRGLAWRADYVVKLAPGEEKLDLSGWVTLTNTSGATYKNAKLQLVAGDINQVRNASPVPQAAKFALRSAPAPTADVQEESLFEYHLYTLPRPTTIAESQTKQVALLQASDVPAKKQLVLTGEPYFYQGQIGDEEQKRKIAVFLEFDNKDSAHLGLPLPKGVYRVYNKDARGNGQFIGEDQADHTPKNEKVRLKLGEAFDVTAKRKQSDFKLISGKDKNKPRETFESAFEIVLKNAKTVPVVVTVQEPIPGDWKVLNESLPHRKANSNLAEWQVSVPAEGSATLIYRVQVR